MCTHRPTCPSIDSPNADTARVVVHHAELGWSMLCNGAIVLDALDQQPAPRRAARRNRTTIRTRRAPQQQPVAA